MHRIWCRKGCGASFAYGPGGIKKAAQWLADHRCAKLPETYRPRHMKETT